MLSRSIEVATRYNRGRHKLGVNAICGSCGQSLTGAKSYTVHIWQTPAMPAPAFSYYHWNHAPAMGSGWGKFVPGERITDPTQVKVGDLLVAYSVQFNAYNLVRVTKTRWEGEPENLVGRKFYGVFVDPKDTRKPRTGSNGEFCVWDHELGRTEMCRAQVEGKAEG